MTKRVFELPVQPHPVIFQVSFSDDRRYSFRTQYREADEAGWILDLYDTAGQATAMGIPLVVGLDLLYQFNHLAFGFALVVLCREGRTTPTYESLGVTDRLLMIVDF